MIVIFIRYLPYLRKVSNFVFNSYSETYPGEAAVSEIETKFHLENIESLGDAAIKIFLSIQKWGGKFVLPAANQEGVDTRKFNFFC